MKTALLCHSALSILGFSSIVVGLRLWYEWLLRSNRGILNRRRLTLRINPIRYHTGDSITHPTSSIMSRSRSAPSANQRPASGTVTTTITIENNASSSSSGPDVLVLRLNRKEKRVSWKEGTVDNEFMNKKNSKKCCIFNKEKPFDEDDSSDEDECQQSSGDVHGGGGCCLKS